MVKHAVSLPVFGISLPDIFIINFSSGWTNFDHDKIAPNQPTWNTVQGLYILGVTQLLFDAVGRYLPQLTKRIIIFEDRFFIHDRDLICNVHDNTRRPCDMGHRGPNKDSILCSSCRGDRHSNHPSSFHTTLRLCDSLQKVKGGGRGDYIQGHIIP